MTEFRAVGENGVGEAEVVVLSDDDRAGVRTARRALGVAPYLEGAEALVERVREQAPDERVAEVEDELMPERLIEPMPGKTPSTPASAQLGASSGGGGSGSRQR